MIFRPVNIRSGGFCTCLLNNFRSKALCFAIWDISRDNSNGQCLFFQEVFVEWKRIFQMRTISWQEKRKLLHLVWKFPSSKDGIDLLGFETTTSIAQGSLPTVPRVPCSAADGTWASPIQSMYELSLQFHINISYVQTIYVHLHIRLDYISRTLF